MRGRQIRTFLVVLGITALVWLAVAMSESHEYTLAVSVTPTGFDAKRYAVSRVDTSLTVQFRATGFNALFLSLREEPPVLQIDVNGEAVRRYTRRRGNEEDLYRIVAVVDIAPQLSEQLSSFGVSYVGSTKDSLLLVLNERASRTFVPDLGALKINFSDGYGLYGEPLVTPAEVTLYGPRDVLETIEHIGVKPVELSDVRQSGVYQVPLDDSWSTLGDVYSTADHLTITIPVKRFIERRFTVPVTVADVDSFHALRLYPDHVELNVWVSQDDLPTVSAESFLVTANYADILAGQQHLKLRVSRFPYNVRIRSVSPSQIDYVIIK